MNKFVFGQTGIVFVMLTILFATPANAQLLWKITGNGLSKPSYLLGTMHYAPAHFIDSIQGLRAVMAEVEQIYGEDFSSDTIKSQPSNELPTLEIPGDSVLADFYSKEEQSRINHFIYRMSIFDDEDDDFISLFNDCMPGLCNLFLLQHFYPNNVELVFGSPIDSLISDDAKTFDDNFKRYAIENNKPVGALDDSTFILQPISAVMISEYSEYYWSKSAQKKQTKDFLSSIDDFARINRKTYQSVLHYCSQNVSLINDNKRLRNNNKEYRKRKKYSIIQGRNIAWAKKMPAIMEEGSTLFAVGVAHLGNPKEKRGLLQLLRKAGYTLEPVSKSDK